ncbi:NitT/TauT family transport system ATP-binding protein [Tistlia consotensis]|uniref:NitT/TauT family transport system ATP-binding protein n=1 Tax=Tistlia consotensis USBA 355 TaxID=560819 RepID=A0A1Y6B3W5_9PROT|nr:ABC transporter ATP-binding protein [Tistlia consotensis]SME90383.1 NitT/TauT family transport system ATP-binding protein [Tistlia consotensis USBA 355]SNR26714.1 NitT/TauT family transport system ATP-binding protein [Tistlia consotensis]
MAEAASLDLDLSGRPTSGAGAPAGVVLREVSKAFGEIVALERVDLTIADGEFVAVVGPSGCGKSTLLRLISRLAAPTTGSITVFDDASPLPPRGMSIVFQNHVLLAWRTVLDNVLFPADMVGERRDHYRDKAMELLETVGLAEFAGRYPHELSGGMRQRAAIARALLLKPNLLLMDEPFGALDALTREQMRLDLEALWLKNRMTVLFITHSIDEAVLLADRVIVMTPRPGRIERIMPVGIRRPRGLAARRDPEFLEKSGEITEIFLSRGVLHRED